MWVCKRDPCIQHASEEKQNHKYVARIPLKKVGGKQQYRYFYDQAEYQAYLKNDRLKFQRDNADINNPKPVSTDKSNPVKSLLGSVRNKIDVTADNVKENVDSFFEKIGISVKDTVSKIPDVANKVVDKAKEVASDLYDLEENIYDVNPSNYDEKIVKIAETDEWKAIVERKDPEYVKKNADGSETLLIDDYLAKKKQPILDVIDDIISNRQITINKIDKDAIISGVKSKIFGTISIGCMAVGVVTKALIEKSKLSQGTYNDEVEDFTETLIEGQKYVKDTLEIASTTANVAKDTVELATALIKPISDHDVSGMLEMVKNSPVTKEIGDVKTAVNNADIVEAARIILNSSTIPENVSSNEYYKQAEKILSGLTEEEIVMVNVLINGIMRG